MRTFVFALLVPFLHVSVTLDGHCDFYQEMAMGQEYYIYNNEYPRFYPKGTSCRWSGHSIQGTVIVMTCGDVELPDSRNCQKDRLVVAQDGDENFRDQNNVAVYCGKTTFTTHTLSNSLAVGLFATADSPGGRFVCSLAAMHVQAGSCSCGIHNEMKIVGGQDAGVNEFPAMAALVDASTEDAYCGATIITSRYVLTGAHCLNHQTPSNLRVLVGEHDRSRNDETTTTRFYSVQGFTVHPLYNSTSLENDIAVVRTTQPIQFNVGVQPICLPFSYGQFSFESEVVTALGWGFQDFSGYKAEVLQKVDLSVVSNEYCNATMRENIQATQICTHGDGKDSCISDSGGPLLWFDSWTKRHYLVGIISFGVGCATTKPAVNTRVTSYLSWIASVTSDSAYCVR